MKTIARALLLLVSLFVGACLDEDYRCEGSKSSGAECFDGCECESGTCLSVSRECL